MRKHKSDRVILFLTLLLLGLGLVVIYAIGPMRANFLNSAYGENYSTDYFFIHQLISVALSVAALIFAFKLPYEQVRRVAKWLIVAGLVACVLLAFLALIGSSLAKCQLGACRWFNFGSLGSFQPAELLKLGLVVYLAQLVAECREKGNLEHSRDFWVPFGIVVGLSLFFVIVVQKDFGSGVPILAIILAIMWMSGMDKKVFFRILGALAILGVILIVSSPHRLQRLMTFGGAEGSDSYHVDNAMIAIGTGGFGGVGVGNSVQATGYLPESINDSVFAVMGETFGFVGLMLVIGCFTLLLLRLLGVAEKLSNTEQSLVVTGVFAWVLAHVTVNIMAMTGVIPLTGITLPLLSYGGTSMIFIALALGLAMQLSCYTGREVQRINYGNRTGNQREAAWRGASANIGQQRSNRSSLDGIRRGEARSVRRSAR